MRCQGLRKWCNHFHFVDQFGDFFFVVGRSWLAGGLASHGKHGPDLALAVAGGLEYDVAAIEPPGRIVFLPLSRVL